jgi:hypothetical protein
MNQLEILINQIKSATVGAVGAQTRRSWVKAARKRANNASIAQFMTSAHELNQRFVNMT